MLYMFKIYKVCRKGCFPADLCFFDYWQLNVVFWEGYLLILVIQILLKTNQRWLV